MTLVRKLRYLLERSTALLAMMTTMIWLGPLFLIQLQLVRLARPIWYLKETRARRLLKLRAWSVIIPEIAIGTLNGPDIAGSESVVGYAPVD
jgi:hypothetical protein